MTTAVLTATTSRAFSFARLKSAWSLLQDGLSEGRRLHASYDRLRRLSDSELARMGLAREEIPQAVAHGY
jgi:uncharacterized protein YjiS (DUF1127 family)